MALDITYLQNNGGSGRGSKLWSYFTAADAKAAVKGTGYFNDASSLLQVGDRIMLHTSDTDFDCHVSAIDAAGVVTIAAIDAFA